MLSKHEFISFVLVNDGLVSKQVYDEIEARFDRLGNETEGKLNEVPLTEALKLMDILNGS